jgi:ferredoxin-NADP reductase
VEGTAVRRRLTWQVATVVDLTPETARTKSIAFDVPGREPHLAGQHVDVRLTAEDGYQAQRSYSIASAPEDESLVLTVERLDDGEVSPYLTDELRPGDQIELRGPIGGYFVWEESYGGPLFLVAGGSGVVPLRAMLRHHSAVGSDVAARLLYSARTLADVIYREELEQYDVRLTLTRERERRRIDRELLDEVGWPPAERPLVYVCGPTAFVETAASLLVEAGHEPIRIRTERFGPSGK